MTSTVSTPGASTPAASDSQPWWRHGHVWLIISGPAIVIVAGIATAVIAVRQPDPVVAEDYYRRGVEINRTLAGTEQGGAATAMMPAVKARNHAADPTAAPAPSPAQAPTPSTPR